MINLADYAIAVFQRLSTGVLLPFRPGELEGWTAKPHFCHANAIEWCNRSPGHTRVPGWLYFDYGGYMDYVRFAAHSVVKSPSGELIDITPSETSRPYPFIAATETVEQYDEVVMKLGVMNLDLYIQDGRVRVHTHGSMADRVG